MGVEIDCCGRGQLASQGSPELLQTGPRSVGLAVLAGVLQDDLSLKSAAMGSWLPPVFRRLYQAGF